MKSNLEDLYLNIKQCILILLKNYTIWSHNLVLLLLKKRTLLSKIPAVSAHESKSSAAGPNFGRGFKQLQLKSLIRHPKLNDKKQINIEDYISDPVVNLGCLSKTETGVRSYLLSLQVL